MISVGGRAQPKVDDDDDAVATIGSAKVPEPPKDPKARDQWLADKLAAALTSRPKLAKIKAAIQVTDLGTGRALYAKDATAPMNLASNAKLLTSTAALATLGAGFHWRTAVYADALPDKSGKVKGDLYLRGRGDPLLSERDLRALADEVAARGIVELDGKLVVDDTYFDRVVEPPHFDEQKAERAGFRAPVAGLGVARSAITVVVTANPADPSKANIRLEPDAGDYVRIGKREVTTVTDGRSKIRVDMKAKGDHVEIDVAGTIRAIDGSFDQRRRVDDPARFAAEVFRRALALRGIKIRSIAMGAVPATAKLVATHEGVTLAAALRDMNKYSDNYLAESVLKTLGAEARAQTGKALPPATWADGTAAVAAYLATIGLPAGSYRADNGSGLFDATRVSAQQLVTILAAANADYRIGPDLVASLPIAGLDGTLAKRWHGHPALGRVRAKTGTLDKVTTLAGYVGVEGGHLLAFAILYNDLGGGIRPIAREAADEMIDVLAAYLGAR